jgi:hypothetical protein
LDDFGKSGGVGTSGHGYSDQSATGLDKLINLPDTAGNINRRHFRHRLDDNRGSRANFNRANFNGLCFSSFNHDKIVACPYCSGKLKY